VCLIAYEVELHRFLAVELYKHLANYTRVWQSSGLRVVEKVYQKKKKKSC
jgi:hypothetical protein